MFFLPFFLLSLVANISAHNQELQPAILGTINSTLDNSTLFLECGICYEPLQNTIKQRHFLCNHTEFHDTCLFKWQSLKRDQISCPLCRAPALNQFIQPEFSLKQISKCLDYVAENKTTLFMQEIKGFNITLQHALFIHCAINWNSAHLLRNFLNSMPILEPQTIQTSFDLLIRKNQPSIVYALLEASKNTSLAANLFQTCLLREYCSYLKIFLLYFQLLIEPVQLSRSFMIAASKDKTDILKLMLNLPNGYIDHSDIIFVLDSLSRKGYWKSFRVCLEYVIQKNIVLGGELRMAFILDAVAGQKDDDLFRLMLRYDGFDKQLINATKGKVCDSFYRLMLLGSYLNRIGHEE